MDLERYVDRLSEQLAIAAAAGGEEARALAERLLAPLDSSVRLMLLDALSAAAAEITRELAPGSVELRLRGGEPEFVVASPRSALDRPRADEAPADEVWPAAGSRPVAADMVGDGGLSRVNLRLPDELKSRVEQAADREGLSINAWLVRAAAAAVAAAERSSVEAGREHGAARGGQRYTGWGR